MTGRLPQLTPGNLSEPQRVLYDSLVAREIPWAEQAGVRALAPDGSLLGPFNALLFNPDLGAAQLGVFRADNASTSLAADVHEVIVLTVGAVWGAGYELYAHTALARTTGLSQAVIDAIVAGEQPQFQSAPQAAAYEFAWQLTHRHRVEPATYDVAAREFGDRGLVDIVLLVGLYETTCALLNAFEVPVPR